MPRIHTVEHNIQNTSAKICKCIPEYDYDYVSMVLQHFYAEPRAAKEILEWSGTTNLPEDLKERFDEYVKIGRDKKDVKFEIDDKILAALKVGVAA